MTHVATLGQLHRPPGWVWVYCARHYPLCQHRAPMALAPLIIRWGPGVERHAAPLRALPEMRPQGRDLAVAGMGRGRRRPAAVPGR